MKAFDFIRYHVIKHRLISHKDVLNYATSMEHPVILEAGAANGNDTLRFAMLRPDATIYAFEPVSVSYTILQQTVQDCPNVHTYPLALGDFNGESVIHISRNQKKERGIASSSSLLNPKQHLKLHPHISFDKEETVQVKTLDAWATEEQVHHVDIMWLDMQGYELKTLQASPRIFSTVKVLYTEVSKVEMFEGVSLYDDYKAWLLSEGFRVAKEEMIWRDQGNVLFIRK